MFNAIKRTAGQEVLTFLLVLPQVDEGQRAAQFRETGLGKGQRIINEAHLVIQREHRIVLGRFRGNKRKALGRVKDTI